MYLNLLHVYRDFKLSGGFPGFRLWASFVFNNCFASLGTVSGTGHSGFGVVFRGLRLRGSVYYYKL